MITELIMGNLIRDLSIFDGNPLNSNNGTKLDHYSGHQRLPEMALMMVYLMDI